MWEEVLDGGFRSQFTWRRAGAGRGGCGGDRGSGLIVTRNLKAYAYILHKPKDEAKSIRMTHLYGGMHCQVHMPGSVGLVLGLSCDGGMQTRRHFFRVDDILVLLDLVSSHLLTGRHSPARKFSEINVYSGGRIASENCTSRNSVRGFDDLPDEREGVVNSGAPNSA